jgi:electron transfer flavoprotein alpha/beta subunit
MTASGATSTVAVWLGASAPARTIRWLDGAVAAAARLGGGVTAVAAGDPAWLDLAADRANRAGLASTGVTTDLHLDYLGWAQVMAAVARRLGATTILVDEASRRERFPEVAAIAELLDAAQLTHVVSLAPDGPHLRATRVAGGQLQTCRIRGPAVLGLRIAGPAIEEYPTPMPAAAMRRFDLPALRLDPAVLGHRALPPRAGQTQRGTVERVAEYLGVHVAPRSRRRPTTQGS